LDRSIDPFAGKGSTGCAVWQLLHSGTSSAFFESCGTYRWGLVFSPLGATYLVEASMSLSKEPWQPRHSSFESFALSIQAQTKMLTPKTDNRIRMFYPTP